MQESFKVSFTYYYVNQQYRVGDLEKVTNFSIIAVLKDLKRGWGGWGLK